MRPKDPEPRDAGASSAIGRRVLVVEDDPPQRRMLRTVLESNGYDVVSVGLVSDAIAELETGTIALVVADVRLPGRSGDELIVYLRANPKLSNVPVVLLSAYGRPRGHQADAFLTKPFEIEHFERVVRRLAG